MQSHNPIRRLITICGVMLIGGACFADPDPQAGRSPQEVADAYQNASIIRLVEDVRYCADEQSAGCQLGPQTFVNLAEEGEVLIGMPGGPITRFSAAGARVAEYGRTGGGPGEYQFAFGAHMEPDGRVVVHDFRQGRRVVFAADGTPLTTVADEPDMGTRDVFLDVRGLAVLSDPPAAPGDSVSSNIKLFRDTVPPSVVAQLPLVRVTDAEGRAQMLGFFEARPQWAIESDSTALVVSGPTLVVRRHFRDGRSEEVLSAPDVGNRAVTADEIERERQRRLSRPSSNAQARDGLVRAVASATKNAARFHPFSTRLRVLGDGSFVVNESEVQADSARWTVFDSSGGVIGQFRLPISRGDRWRRPIADADREP